MRACLIRGLGPQHAGSRDFAITSLLVALKGRRFVVDSTDVKVSEAAAIGPDRLLIMERISRTTKIYRVHLTPRFILPVAHLNQRSRPTLEQLSGADNLLDVAVPVLAKTLVLSTDDARELDRDLEGLVVLSSHELLLVNDNDFSVEGARTRFWRLRLERSLF